MTASTTSAAAKAPAAPAADLRANVHAFFVNLSGWLQSHWLQIIIAAAVAAVIVIVLYALRGLGSRLCRPDRPTGSWLTIAGRIVSRTTGFFIIMVAVRLVSGYAAPPGPVAGVVDFLFTVAVVFQGAIWARALILGLVEHRTSAEHYRGEAILNAMGLIRLLVSVAVFAIAIVVLLDNLGVNVTGLVAGLGIGGIAIGLAAQGIFADLFAALAILFDKPFLIGDSISYDKGAGSGTVEAIGLKSTRVRGGNGEMRIVANKKLLDFEILNTTDRTRNRFKFDFTLGYATPPDLVEQIPAMLREAVESQGYKLVHGGLNGFGAHGLSYDVEFESNGPDFPEGARDKVAAALLARFRDRQISFAYPTHVNLLAEKTKPTPPANAEPA
jgi:small-conductance mechanosensitive channel